MVWDRLRYFEKSEFGMGADNLEPHLVLELDEFRHFLGHPIHINVAYATTGHSPNSQHYLGRAVDCYSVGLSLWDFYQAARSHGFTGIGVYPQWVMPGLHLDVRDSSYGKTWAQYDGIYQKVLPEHFLNQYGKLIGNKIKER